MRGSSQFHPEGPAAPARVRLAMTKAVNLKRQLSPRRLGKCKLAYRVPAFCWHTRQVRHRLSWPDLIRPSSSKEQLAFSICCVDGRIKSGHDSGGRFAASTAVLRVKTLGRRHCDPRIAASGFQDDAFAQCPAHCHAAPASLFDIRLPQLQGILAWLSALAPANSLSASPRKSAMRRLLKWSTRSGACPSFRIRTGVMFL